MKHYQHITRVLILLSVFLALGFIVRAALVPPSFNQYGPYRGDDLIDKRSPEPVYRDDDYCLECHEKEWDMADGRHAYVPCENCHFLSVPHAAGKPREIVDIVMKYARHASELAFQTLYAVMSTGWDEEKIREIIEKLNENDLEMRIRIFRGGPVIRQFGDIEGQREIREGDPDIMKALREGKDILSVYEGNIVRHIYPVIAKKECMECHTEGKEGDVNGVIDVTFPVNLAIPKGKEKQIQIADIMREDARHASRLVFESLYSVMRRGWQNEKIRGLVERFNRNDLNMTVRIFRGGPVIKQFGEIEGERELRESDPDIMKALRVGNDIEVSEGRDEIRYLYPVKTAEGCSVCHRGEKADILGVIDVNFPIKRLKVKGLKKLADMPVDRSQKACAICHAYTFSRPVKFPQIKDFDKHYDDYWKRKMGLMDKEAPCMKCHNAHMPRIVKKGSSN